MKPPRLFIISPLAALCLLPGPLRAIEFTIPEELRQQAEAAEVAEEDTSGEMSFAVEGPEPVGTSEEAAPADGEGAEVPEETAYGLESAVAVEGGRIFGQVFDRESNAPLQGVAILIEGTEFGTLTDEKGDYVLTGVPSGSYTLSFFKTGYIEANVTETEVAVDEPSRVDLALPPRPVEMSDDVYELQDFTVTARQLSEQMESFVALRQSAVGSVDFLSAEDMARFGGSDIADVVKRVPGVNVVEGKFAVVRGLSDRYNSTEVNNLPMPSPDPLRQGLQLDLFPTSIIENVVTNKMFLPDLPGNSAGGAFELTTKSFSDEWFAKVKAGFRVNDNAQDLFLRSPESSSDDLLFRGMDARSATYNSSDNRLSRFAGYDGSALFNGSFAASFGGGIEYRDERRLRYLVSASYDASSKTKMGGSFQNQYADNSQAAGLTSNRGQAAPAIPRFRQGDPPGPRFIAGFPPGAIPPGSAGLIDPNYPNNLNVLFVPGSLATDDPFLLSGTQYEAYVQSETSVLGGLLLGLRADLDPEGNNVITFTSLNSLSANDTVTRFEDGVVGPKNVDLPGQDPADNPAANGDSATVEIVEYEERQLNALQLSGSHADDGSSPTFKFDWAVGHASVTSEVPLRSESFFFKDAMGTPDSSDDEYFIVSSSFAGENPFLQESSQNIEQDTLGGRMDFDVSLATPLDEEREAVFGAGVFFEDSERTVSGRNAAYIGQSAAEAVRAGSPRELSRALHELGLSEFTLNGGPFETEALVTKEANDAYLMLEVPIWDRFKVSGGARLADLVLESQGSSALAGNQGTGAGQDGFTLQQLLDGSYNSLGGEVITNGDILGWSDADAPGLIEEQWLLPALVLQFDATEKLTFRLGYSQTFALPSFRELSPYFDYESSTGDIILGNPFLRPSEVESFDIRADYTLKSGGYAAVSLFMKTVADPIERVKLKGLAGFEFTSYFNNKDEAVLKGVELEARHNLGFLESVNEDLEFLENVSFGFNVTVIDAAVDRPPQIVGTYFTENNGIPQGPFVGGDIPEERGLYDQPEWIANFDVTVEVPQWGSSATLAVYAQSDVLSAVGAGDAEGNQLSTLDEYTAGYHQLDFSLRQRVTDNFSLSLKIGNVTDSERKVIYDPDLVDDFERYSYRDGRTYSISGTYEF